MKKEHMSRRMFPLLSGITVKWQNSKRAVIVLCAVTKGNKEIKYSIKRRRRYEPVSKKQKNRRLYG